MICLICRQAEIIYRLTSVKFERAKIHFVITNVPTRVCPSCREAYLDEDTASQLLNIAKGMTEAGVLDAHCEYNNV